MQEPKKRKRYTGAHGNLRRRIEPTPQELDMLRYFAGATAKEKRDFMNAVRVEHLQTLIGFDRERASHACMIEMDDETHGF